MNQYQYSPLRSRRGEFRLLSLLPGPISAEIGIEIFHVKRSSKPEYEALSYVWGPSERTDTALVCGPAKPRSQFLGYLGLQQRHEDPDTFRIGITGSLAVALRNLRHPTKPKILWIDALCINQDDLAERSAEVLGMDLIYSNAVEVIVWLGPKSENSGLAIETLSRIGKDVHYSAKRRKFRYRTERSWAERLVDDAEALKSNAPSWIAIRDLLRRDWFTRLWVFQEIGLATNATIFIGEDHIDWQRFTAALYWIWPILGHLNQIIYDLAFEDFASSSISGFLDITERGDPQDPAVGWLLDKTMKLSCFDPRDRLFAIRGLAPIKMRDFIVPDYTKSVEEVYKDFTIRRTQATGDGNIFCRCLLQVPPSKLVMPSWVPDLSIKNLPRQVAEFHACGRSRLVAANDHEKLKVQARKMATISSLTSFVKPDDSDAEIVESCRSWKQLCSSDAYVGGGSTFDAFLETVLCGEILELMPPDFGDCMSLKECKMVLQDLGGTEGVRRDGNFLLSLASKFVRNVRTCLAGRSFFQTREGFIGICPESANEGDQVIIMLGCSTPLIIRPVTLPGKLCYRLVGECYVSGLMHGEGLLGPLPFSWSVKYYYISGQLSPTFMHRGAMTQKDPRVPLPSPWRHGYGPGNVFRMWKRMILNICAASGLIIRRLDKGLGPTRG